MTCTVWCGVVVKKRSRFLDGIGAFLYGVYEMRRKNRISLLLAGALLTVPFGMGVQAADATGDVNADGVFDATDAALLQNWLLGQEVTLPDGQAGDLNGDGMLNGMDLCLMKRGLLTNAGRQVTVSDAAELAQAMAQAKAGDVIRLEPGVYQVSDSGAQKFYGTAEGSQQQPITLKAADPADPPVLTGTGTSNGYVMHITGDYWVLEHLLLTNAQKGIVLDNSNHTVIRSCEIVNTGAEAVAIRDGSSYCLVQQCSIHDTGLVTPGYGEGVYIGSAYSTSGFDYKCDYNRVDGCVFRNVAAEHVDVKEYTTGTEISGCTFHGEGMTGENYAGSFLDIAGNDCYVHDNTGYRDGNSKIVAAFELHEQVSGWGYHAHFANNTLYMDRPYGEVDTSRRMYVVDGWYSDFSVQHNLVDYGEGLSEAGENCYNLDQVTFLTEDCVQ